jgi:hypothetical protein
MNSELAKGKNKLIYKLKSNTFVSILELKQRIKDKELKRDELINCFNLNKLKISENKEYEGSFIKIETNL